MWYTRTNVQTDVPAMLITPGNVTNTYIGDVDMNSVSQKQCRKCGEWKDASQFYREKQNKDGLGSYCKICNDKTTYQYREKKSVREAMCSITKAWRLKHPEKHIEYDLLRRARKNNNGGIITAAEWEDLKKKYNYTCLCCYRREPEIKLTLDHVVPLVSGGSNTISNAQPLCGTCNSSKGRKTIDYR